jgi:hypothetical protein
MSKKLIVFLIITLFLILFFFLYLSASQEGVEKGTLSIYFMQEQVGYEEYSWEEEEYGFTLTVRGRMTKPVAIEIDELVIHLDSSFIPLGFVFKGKVSGVDQEVRSIISDGEVVSVKKITGQEQTETVNIKRDAFLLPNPVFSPYMVLTKKFRCGLQEKVSVSAYIIPQMEVAATLELKEDAPCRIIMRLSTTQIELETDEEGTLNAIDIPSQNLRVLKTMTGHPNR